MRQRRLAAALALAAFALPGIAASIAEDATAGSVSPGAKGCAGAVPCGYIYPLLLIELDKSVKPPFPLQRSAPFTLDANLTFRFDAVNEGFAAPDPQSPIVVSFEFPRKPEWAGLAVEPPQIEIPILPQYLQPDASDPTNLQASYVYTVDLRITVRLGGQAVLADGAEFAKLLVFAKSTESGLYKSGYGIKELRVIPEGFIRESSLAGSRDAYEASPVPEQEMGERSRETGGILLSLAPDGPVSLWKPQTYTLTLKEGDAPVAASVTATLTDEDGTLVYSSGPRPAPTGSLRLNLTLPGVGLHKLGVFAEPIPPSAGAFPPTTASFDLRLEPAGAEGILYPKEYVAGYYEIVTGLQGNAVEPLFQYETRIPFPALPGATGAYARLALDTSGLGASPGRGGANLQLTLLDPEGAVLLQGTVDPANPVRSWRVGALPGSGWFTARVQGTGLAPAAGASDVAAAYRLDLKVAYEREPTARNPHDGILHLGARNVAWGPLNFSLSAGDGAPLSPWAPAALFPLVERDDGGALPPVAYAVSVVNATGETVYSSGVRVGDASAMRASFTPPSPGRFVAHVRFAPAAAREAPAGATWEPLVLAFPFEVGPTDEPTVQYPATYALEDEGEIPAMRAHVGAPAGGALPRDVLDPLAPVSEVVVPVYPGATALRVRIALVSGAGVARAEILAPDGAVVASASARSAMEEDVVVDRAVAGRYTVRVSGASPDGARYLLGVAAEYGLAPTAVNPGFVGAASGAPAGRLVAVPAALATAVAIAAATAVLVLLRRP